MNRKADENEDFQKTLSYVDTFENASFWEVWTRENAVNCERKVVKTLAPFSIVLTDGEWNTSKCMSFQTKTH